MKLRDKNTKTQNSLENELARLKLFVNRAQFEPSTWMPLCVCQCEWELCVCVLAYLLVSVISPSILYSILYCGWYCHVASISCMSWHSWTNVLTLKQLSITLNNFIIAIVIDIICRRLDHAVVDMTNMLHRLMIQHISSTYSTVVTQNYDSSQRHWIIGELLMRVGGGKFGVYVRRVSKKMWAQAFDQSVNAEACAPDPQKFWWGGVYRTVSLSSQKRTKTDGCGLLW